MFFLFNKNFIFSINVLTLVTLLLVGSIKVNAQNLSNNLDGAVLSSGLNNSNGNEHFQNINDNNVFINSMPYFGGACVAGTVNRFTGSYHSNLYIGNNNGSNILLAWGQSMATYANITASSGTDVYVPTLVPASQYSGVPYEVRSSSSGGANGLSAMLLRTSTNLYLFGTAANITAITSLAGFGGAAINTAASNITSKLPTGVAITDIAQMAVSQKAIALITNAGHVYMMTANAKLQGDSAATSSSVWHHVTLKTGAFLTGVTKFSLTSTGAFALTSTGKIYYWGAAANVNGVVNTTISYLYPYDMSAQIPSGQNVTDVVAVDGSATATTNTLFILCTNNKVYVSGLNTMGVLGQNNVTTTFNQPTFITVKTTDGTTDLTNVTRIDGDTEADICTVGAMTSDGSIYGWGDNSATILGATGNASTGSKANPITVKMYGASQSGFSDFSVAGHFTIAFYNSGATDQYWYVGHSIGGSQGAGVAASGTGYTVSTSPIKIDASPLGISFDCSNTQPTISASGSFSAFSSCTNLNSANQTITISGLYLSNSISITAPTGFEISTSSGSGFGSTATLSQSGGVVAATTLYVRTTSIATGSLSGTLSLTSTGASSISFSISGVVNTLPVVTSATGNSKTGSGTLLISANTASAGSTIDWYQNNTGGAALVSGTLSTTSYTTPVITNTTSYYAQARNLTTSCISAARTAAVATINGSLSAGTVGTSQTICYNSAPTAFTSIAAASGGTGAITYQWQISSDNLTFTNISGATLATYVASALTQTTYYRRAATTSADGTIYTIAITITVNSLPTATSPIDNARTGSGPVILSISSSSGATIDWYANSTGGSVLASGNGVNIYTTPSISVTTTYFAEARASSAPGCIAANRVAVLATINGSFAPGSIGADQTICSGVTPSDFTSITSASGGTGAISYQWQVSTDNISFTDISGATLSTYSPPSLTQTKYYKRTAITTHDGSIYSNIVTVTVNPLPSSPVAVPGSRYGTGTVDINATINSGETVDWYNSSTGGSILSGGTGTTLFTTPSIAVSTNYYAQARNSTTACIQTTRTSVAATINPLTTPTVSVTVGTYTFTGSSIGPNAATNTGTGISYTYSYSGTGLTSYGPSATRPTNNGTYAVTATVSADGIYNGASSSATNFTIAKATPTVSVTVGTYTYTGSSVGPNASTNTGTGSTYTYSYSGASYGPSVTRPTNAGTYSVTSSVAADGNFNAASSNETSFSINKAIPVVTVTVGTYNYNGSTQGPDAATNTGTGSSYTYSYSGTGGTTYGPSATKPTSVGSYLVTATLASSSDGNYNSANSSATSFSIGLGVPIVTPTIGTYNYIALTPQGPNAATNTGTGSSYTFSYSGTSGTIYGPSATRPINIGSYLVTVTVAANGNYTSTSSVATLFTINDPGKTTPTVTVAVGTYTYTGSSQGPNTATNTGTGNSYSYSYIGASYGPSATAPTNAGTYSVTASVLADGSYNSANSSATSFTINKLTPTVSVTVGTYNYNGSAQGPDAATNTGTASSYTFSYSGAGYGPTANRPTNAGTYSVTVSVGASSDGNYNSANSNPNSFTILKAIPVVTPTVGSYTYNGSGQGPIAATNTGTGSSYTYSYTGVDYSPSALPPTNAGTYSVTVSVAVDGNYNSTNSSPTLFTILRAAPVVTVSVGTYTYTGSAIGPNAASNTGTGSSYTFSYSGIGSTSYGPSATMPTNVGDYAVTVTVAGNGNFSVANSSATSFSIIKATPIVSPTIGTYTYTGLPIGPNAATNTGTGIGYTFSYTGAGYSPNATPPTNVGTYSVTVTVDASSDGNFNSANSNAISFTILKSTPVVTPTIGIYSYAAGTPQGPNAAMNTGTGNIYTYSYSGTGTTVYGPSASQPTNAGDYLVTVNLAASSDGQYNSASSTATSFTITKATPIVTPTIGSYTFNGSVQGPNVASNTGTGNTYTFSYSGSGTTIYGPTATRPINFGNYFVTATVAATSDGNFNTASSEPTTFEIAILSRVTPTVSPIIETYIYNEMSQGPETASNTGTGNVYTFSYSGTGSTTYGPTDIKPTSVGTYVVVVTVALSDDGYYNSASSASTSFSIDRITPTVTPVIGTYTYNASAQGPNAATNTGTGNSYIYSYSGAGSTSYGPSSSKPINAGSYTVIATVASNGNYSSSSSSATSFTINAASSTITATGLTTYTYNASAQGPSTSTKSGSTGVVTYSYSGTGTTTYSASAIAPTNAGTYQVVASVATDGNYNAASSSAYAFTINKAIVSKGNSTIVVSGLTIYTFNGLSQGPKSSTVNGSTGAVTYSYSGTGTTTYSASATAPTNIGNYQVIASVASDDNYNEANSVAYTFDINKASTLAKGSSSITVTGSNNYTYNGFSQGPSKSNVSGSLGLVTYTYSGTGSTAYASNTKAPILPGTYKVIATLAADDSYEGVISSAYEFSILQVIVPPLVKNEKYLLDQPSIPSTLIALVISYPIGSVPAWCDIDALNCSTNAPKTPAVIGNYVYQLRSYDTTTLLYSTNFVNDTLVIAPTKPSVIDTTFVLGVKTNPSNISGQVSGLAGATYNFYINNILQKGTPLLSRTPGTISYSVSQVVNNIESDKAIFKINIIDPTEILQLDQIIDSGILQSNSTFNYPFTFTVRNLISYQLMNVVITDNLHNTIPITSDFTIIKNTATGSLISNSSFNANEDIEVTQKVSMLAPLAKSQASFTLNLMPNGFVGTISNIAYVKADTKWGTIEAPASSAKFYVKDLIVSIPEGFSPNHDGVHDNFVIIRPSNITIDLVVFNRWGNFVYTNSNYKNEWDGTGTGNFQGQDLPEGGYYYTVRAIDDKGVVQLFNGYVILKR